MGQEDIMAKLESFLNEMGVKYQKEEGILASYWRIGAGEYWVFVFVADRWVAMRSRILEADQVPNDPEFLRELLRTHYRIAEVRYDIEDDGSLGTSRTIPVDGLNRAVFESSFNSIVFAIEYFRDEIAKRFGIDLSEGSLEEPHGHDHGSEL